MLLSDLHICHLEISLLLFVSSEIMDLANKLTYNSKLKCISDKVANQRLTTKEIFLNRVYCKNIGIFFLFFLLTLHILKLNGEMKEIFEKSIIFIDTTSLIRNQAEIFKNSNPIECDIVCKLIKLFLEVRFRLSLFFGI